jgi:multicomponent Na+:H+ antiporter subunit D
MIGSGAFFSFLSDHLAILQVAFPLIMAPVCSLFSGKRWPWMIAALTTFISLIISCLLLGQISQSGDMLYSLGGWEPPYGIGYRIDKLTAYMLFIVNGMAMLTLLFAFSSVRQEIAVERHGLFYSVYLVALTGLLGIICTNDAFNIYVFMEISSLASYTLIAMGRNRRALTAAFQYLILGTVGATLILTGVGLLYMMTGSLNLSDIQVRLAGLEDTRPVIAAFVFILAGVAIKAAIFPFHWWLPNAYAYAPSFISAFFAASATKVAVYLLIRFFYFMFPEAYIFEEHLVAQLLIALSMIAIIGGSLLAVYENNLKRMLAFSSVAQIGYITLGLGLYSEAATTASLVHLFNHAITKGTLFLALGCLSWRYGTANLQTIRGMSRTMPLAFAALTLSALSLIGVPLTAGFISKWYLIQAALEQEQYIIVATVLAGSLLAIIYCWKMFEAAMFSRQEEPNLASRKDAPLLMTMAAVIGALLCLYFGLQTELSAGYAASIASGLFEGGQ